MKNRKSFLALVGLTLSLSMLFLGAAYAESAWPALHKGSGLWLWRETMELVNSEKAREEFFAFCANPPGAEGPIQTVYLYGGNEALFKDPAPLRRLLKEMHRHGMVVHFLDGDQQWAFPRQRPIALQQVQRVIDFNNAGAPEERFDGIQFDVEPYVLPTFNQPESIRSYREHMKEVYDKVKKEGKGILYGIAMPVFYDTRNDQLMEYLIDHTDYVALMDYKDNAELIIQAAKSEMEYAAKTGKKVVIGIELQAPNTYYGVSPQLTFYEEGAKKMKEETAKVAEAYRSFSSYAGIAYHDYKNYKVLPLEAKPIVRPNLPEMNIPSAPSGVVIDGDLKEWAAHPSELLDKRTNIGYLSFGRAWTGPEDHSSVLWSAWGEKGLYVALQVTDNVIYRANSGLELWRDDHVGLWIDADLDGDFLTNTLSTDDYQLVIAPPSKNKPAELVIFQPESAKGSEKSSGIQWAVKPNEKGYALEVLIPWAFLKVTDPSQLRGVGLMIEPSDTDNAENEQKVLFSTSGRTRQWGNPTTFRVAPFLR